MARMLFVTWKDDTNPSQFSVPPETSLTDILFPQVDLARAPVLADGNEIYLDSLAVRTAYLIDVPDNTYIQRVEHTTIA